MRIFIGFDPREAVAYHVCVQSIIEHCKRPQELQFTPVTGERRDGSNDFIYARFLIPELCGYQGMAVFLDGDMLVRDDIAELFAPMDEAVKVVKHDYKTRHPIKYLGNKNEDYPRKNWSSVVVWNCGHPANQWIDLKQPGSYLHRFAWLKDEQIGALPAEWNKLVLEQELSPSDKLRHFTIGTPCFPEYRDCDGASEWHDTFTRATVADPAR